MPFNSNSADESFETRRRAIYDTFIQSGRSENFAAQMTELMLAKELKSHTDSVLTSILTRELIELKSKLPALDVQVALVTTEEVKNDTKDDFPGYLITFVEPKRVTPVNRTSWNAGVSSNIHLQVPGDNGLDFDNGRSSPTGFISFIDLRESQRPYASTSHPKSSAARIVVEAILVRKMSLKERFLSLGMGYENMMRRGLDCHVCFPLRNVEKLDDDMYRVGNTIPGAQSRVDRMEYSLRKHVLYTLREKARDHPAFKYFKYSELRAPYFYENTGKVKRCFDPSELCTHTARQAITAFSARQFSLQRLVEIMDVKGIEILHGAEPLSKSMLRFETGDIPLFEQTFYIDIAKDEMRIYNNDEADDYVYKYSQIRQYFFEQGVVHNGRVYTYRHEFVNSSLIMFVIRKMPLGIRPVKCSPVVDIRDNFEF
ncbi:hypothetical protein G6F22_008060 [Rhizopus arrhizus]|nr:hypothetical protein G6F24_011710 [Rhizopus arrhizus]KAG1412013.1 hypothetical protein G6F58_008249 [Rhizopus delemar]KAG0785148.1 hypothetical protein G6F22_008060 [Rhizopus arrhizus]KAG0905772.1 hypothetical protein G6F33_011895 [Rhizopus arrhizus]KAG1109338.1 hypothetical protein G6F42_015683 [Rhizopus arrhizus]